MAWTRISISLKWYERNSEKVQLEMILWWFVLVVCRRPLEKEHSQWKVNTNYCISCINRLCLCSNAHTSRLFIFHDLFVQHSINDYPHFVRFTSRHISTHRAYQSIKVNIAHIQQVLSFGIVRRRCLRMLCRMVSTIMWIEILVEYNECGLAVAPWIPDINGFIAETIFQRIPS